MKESIQLHNQTEFSRNPRESFGYLNSLLHIVSEEISSELETRFGIKNLINTDCTIRMEAFESLNPTVFAEDIAAVKDKESEWSGVRNANTRAFRINEYHMDQGATDDELIQRHLEEKSKEKSRQLEIMITILLHKVFGDRYIVARTAKLDDYFGGVDNVIVNKETGDVICAFDEVRGHPRSDRATQKSDRMLEMTRSGGAELIYGFTVEDGQVKLRSMKNLPIFYLELGGDEYVELKDSIEYSGSRDLNPVEKKFTERILASIQEQKDRLTSDAIVMKNVSIMDNLNKVDELLHA